MKLFWVMMLQVSTQMYSYQISLLTNCKLKKPVLCRTSKPNVFACTYIISSEIMYLLHYFQCGKDCTPGIIQFSPALTGGYTALWRNYVQLFPEPLLFFLLLLWDPKGGGTHCRKSTRGSQSRSKPAVLSWRHRPADGHESSAPGQGLGKHWCQLKQFIKMCFCLKIRQSTFGTLGWGGNCLAEAPRASTGVKAHGHPDKHDADAIATDFRVEGRIRDKFPCQGSVDF